jgi:ectoine hydroxylase
VYVVYNAIANKPRELEKPRADHVCSTNTAPISMGVDADILAAAEHRKKTTATT